MATVKLTVQAGPHRRVNCPVSTFVPAGKTISTGSLTLGRKNVPCSIWKERGGIRVHWVVADLAAGKNETVTLTTGKASASRAKGVAFARERGKVSVSIGGQHFTTYAYGKELARPHLYPVIGPYGDPITRRLATPEDGRKMDHHHHRSIWVSHGEVNSFNNWAEGESHARTVHTRFEALDAGDAAGRIVARGKWVGSDGWIGPHRSKVLVDERTAWTFYNTSSDVRIIDLHLTLTAVDMDICFGDTKEGGLASIRVEESMEVKRGLGGKITNGINGIDEDETWGKRAPWCHYSGPVKGKTVGAAIMDHPDSFRHPTYWHVRNYGLMTANPFGLSHYHNDPTRRGHHVLAPGESIVGIYRYYFHKGDAQKGNITERYHDFANPPHVLVG